MLQNAPRPIQFGKSQAPRGRLSQIFDRSVAYQSTELQRPGKSGAKWVGS
jgi:hypothetical protein